MKKVIITQARYGSSRLPGKILKRIAGKTLLDIHLHRLRRSRLVDEIIVATTLEKEADEIVNIASSNNCSTYQGSMNDVLDRFYNAALNAKADVVVRVTSDCPLNDGVLIDEVLSHFLNNNFDYFSNVNPPTFPDGLDIEVFSFTALEKAWKESFSIKDREHVTPYLRESGKFKTDNFYNSKDESALRMTVDNQEDFDLISALINQLGFEKDWIQYVEYLSNHSNLQQINKNFKRNEGY